ncbi:MAG: DUF4124 domain-containing protein [Wenzhouxiangella sp.]|nr:DUF4124 domain-containing protein [Wenzhouxiangella sp.]
MLSYPKIDIRPVLAVLTLLATVLMAGPVISQPEQDIFTWTDDEGVRHFSAYPPVDREYERVETLPGATRTRNVPPPQQNRQPPEIPEMREAAPDPEVIAERCEQARTNLELLQQDRPAMLRQEDGEPTPLNDDQRQQMIEETEQFIDEWC